jgi:hypothetical protein
MIKNRMGKSKIAVERNPHNDTWDIGWLWNDGDFTPHYCGYPTRKAAEAQIPDFDERVEREQRNYEAEKEAAEREQNEQWPNIGHVRQQIKKLHERGEHDQAFDARWKLDELLDMERHEHISWPLPSWKALKSRTL